MMRNAWLRAGLILLIGVDAVVSLWQYLFPRSFFEDVPTVRLDPPFNEHLMSDVGGLGLALVTVLVFAAATMERRLVLAALTGFAVYALTHLLFHLRHFEHFSAREALGLGTGLGIEAALTLALLVLYWRLDRGRSREGA
ncbi:hypothetical protein [Dactylosporangium sp. CA-139066]|uniref:hypothetical protein n=1 Tax=Dactylosporangium sp. CA-139066 TaxID=3239930 RepID=UPI003D947D23